MKKTILILVIAALGAAVLPCCSKKTQPSGGLQNRKTAAKYYCPMHPNCTSDRPGTCSICGMTLVPIEERSSPAEPETHKKIMYRSTMNPKEISSMPGKDSMGMEMEPFDAEEAAGTAGLPGMATVRISSEKLQTIGVKTERVKKRDLVKKIITVGKVAYDPDLYYAQQEYISSYRFYGSIKDSPQKDAVRNAAEMLDSSKFKLKLMGMSGEQIDALGTAGSPDRSLLSAEGSSNVWVYATIYEQDYKLVKPGQHAKITAASLSRDSYEGKIIALDPVLDPGTRSARARITVPNENGVLKPEFFVNVEVDVPLGVFTAVPVGAVIDTGERKIVFVDRGNGLLEPRAVITGFATDEYYSVISGVSEGDVVVTSANFLLDSESSIRAAVENIK